VHLRLGNIVAMACLALSGAISGCQPKVDVLAVEKELYVVYGVLHPDHDEQYIRVAKVFQLEGDALVYAGAEDLSATDMNVKVTGADTSYQAELVTDQVREPGIFSEEQAIYRINTPVGHRLVPGSRYHLDIQKQDDPTIHITAWTDVPTQPEIKSPGGEVYSPLSGIYTYTSMDFYDDQVVRFYTGTGNGFELRIFVDFWDGEKVATARWGPTRVFRDPRGCVENTQYDQNCYEITRRSVGASLATYVNAAPGPVAMLDSIRVARSLDSLSRHVRLEVTAIDTFLATFLHANTPFGFGLNLLMDKPEVSNISGDNVGVFGSINTGLQYFYLGACARYQAGFSNTDPGYCD
jgi:hypothetical protein